MTTTITTDDIADLGGSDLMRSVGCVYPDIQPPHWGDDDEEQTDADTIPVSALRDIRDEISCLIDAAVEEYAQSGQMRRYDACQLLEFLGGALRNGH